MSSPRGSRVGVRYSHKRFDRTIEDTGVLVPGIGEVFRITNPGESIGENVLRDFAAARPARTSPSRPATTTASSSVSRSASATAGR